MQRYSNLRLFALFIAVMASIPSPGRAGSENTEAAVVTTVDRLTDAGLKRDVESLRALYSAQYFHTNADGSVMTLADVLRSYTEPTEFRFDRSITSERHVVISHHAAVVSQVIALHGYKADAAFTSRYRITYVLVRERNRWLVLNSHASLLGIDK
jgi:hypothetical protein